MSDKQERTGRDRAASLSSIGREVGVDPSLVSRVLRGDPQARISPLKRESILEVARRTGYRPNRVARSLRTQQTNILAMLTPDITNPFHSWLFRAVEEEANCAGYDVILCNTDDDPVRSEHVISALCEGHVDGVLSATATKDDASLDLLRQLDIPYVLLNRRRDRTDETWFGPDAHGIGRWGCEHLLGFGHRRIAYFDGDTSIEPIGGRKVGFLECLKDAGITPDPRLIVSAVAHRSAARDLALKTLSLPASTRPTAFFVPNSMLADGVVSAIYSTGLRIPQDVSVVGLSAVQDPEVTSICVPTSEMGHRAVRWLIDLLDRRTPEPSPVQRVLDVKIVERGSVAAAPA